MTNTIKIVNDFTNKVKEVLLEDTESLKILDTFLELSEDEKTTLLKNFFIKFTKINNGLEFLNNKKNKLFSSKEEETYAFSISLYGENLPLKRIFNGLDDGQTKNYLWICLKLLINHLKPEEDKVENSLLKIKVDKNTNQMIEDIVGVFKEKFEDGKTNPLESIMEVTSVITEKYQDKIQNGDIKLDSIMSELETKIPGVKNMLDGMIPKEKPKKDTVLIDENFSTSNVKIGEDKPDENGMDMGKMLKMMNQLSGKGGLGDLMGGGNILEMLGKDKESMEKLMKDKFNINMDDFKKH